ncbi:unnamed protein product, partial [Didymodactylos carnosus]
MLLFFGSGGVNRSSVIVSGIRLPSILQWYRSNKNNFTQPIASQFDQYPVHISDQYRYHYELDLNGTLKINKIQIDDNDTYECRLILIDRGLLDIKEKYFIYLRVNEKPRFLNVSSSISIVEHYSTINLFCDIYGVPEPIVSWYKLLKDDLQLLLINSKYFILQNVDDRLAGRYKCIGNNSLGSIENDFRVLVKDPPLPSSTVSIKNLTLIRNNLGIAPCLLESYPHLESVSWYKNSTAIQIESKGLYTINTEYSLIIQSVTSADDGFYFCRAQNSEGFGYSSTFYVETKEPIKFILKPNDIYRVREYDI